MLKVNAWRSVPLGFCILFIPMSALAAWTISNTNTRTITISNSVSNSNINANVDTLNNTQNVNVMGNTLSLNQEETTVNPATMTNNTPRGTSVDEENKIAYANNMLPKPTAYRVTALEGLSNADSLNDMGYVAGQIPPSNTNDGRSHAALWKQGRVTDLGMVGCRSTVTFCWSAAYGVNNNGMVVGESHVANSWPSPYFGPWSVYYPHETSWTSGKANLVKTVGWEFGTLKDINDNGNSVGHGRSTDWSQANGDYRVHGYVLIGSTVNEIGSYGQPSKAFAINNVNQAVGEITINGNSHAFLWDGGVVTDLGTLGGVTSSANDLSDGSLRVVGWSKTDTGHRAAFFWENGIMTALRALNDSRNSTAQAINSAGQIVGQSGNKAVVWINKKIYDLNAMLTQSTVLLTQALDINESGEVLVEGQGGYFLLQPEF